MEIRLDESWKALLRDEIEKTYFKSLTDFVRSEYLSTTIYPPPKFIFNALDSLPVDQVKVVILGQDPYHGPGQAHGLSFSVPDGIKPPPSLQNIYKEIKSDLGKEIPQSGNLEKWVKQGVLLLNATLTVRAHQAGSHQNHGWEQFTDTIIQKLSENKSNLVFMLWGAYAQKKGSVIKSSNHLILKAPHPSPFSAHSGFFGCKHFSQTNSYLMSQGISPIDW